MNSKALKLYHRLPGSLRSLAASARGYQLRFWYYGPETGQLVEEALERDGWGRERWEAWQKEELAYVLHRAATRVPYYREHWAARRRGGDRSSWEELENWPILEKETLRQRAAEFIAEDRDPRAMFRLHTSGTSGTPLTLWWGRMPLRAWHALLEARGRRWNHVSLHDRWARLGGQLVTPIGQRKPPFWVWNAAFRQLYMSTNHLSPDLIPYYLDALARFRVRYLFGYSSALNALAQGALRAGRDDLHMAVAITIAEPVFDYQRRAITAAFGCPVRETYGMAEAIAGASQCEADSLHLWPEVGVIEVLEGDRPVREGGAGDLICTGLMNADMPLIRYRVGDRGRLAPGGETCACGRGLPILRAIEGRTNDLLLTREGGRVFSFGPVFHDLPVREAQIVQESLDRVRVRYAPAPGFAAEAGQSITERLRARLGDIEVILESVDEVPRGANGKFRAVVCNLLREETAGSDWRDSPSPAA